MTTISEKEAPPPSNGEQMTKNEEKQPPQSNNITIKDYQFGIWKLQVGVPHGRIFQQQWGDIKASLPFLFRLASDIYNVAPVLFLYFVFCRVWQGVEKALLLHLSSKLLRIVEVGLISGKPDVPAILIAIAYRLVCSLLAAYLQWHGDLALLSLKSKVISHYNLYLMKARLRVDLPTSQKPSSKEEASAADAHKSLEALLSIVTRIVSVISQLTLIVLLSKSTGGPIFALLCVAKPIMSAFFSRSLWDKVSFGYATDENYRRMKAFEQLSSAYYRQDVISGHLGDWIVKEYEMACRKVDGIPVEHPFTQYYHRDSPLFSMLSRLLEDSPMIYCALCIIIAPSKFSVASIAILQHSAGELRYSLETVFRSNEKFRHNLATIKGIYAQSKIVNSLSDGDMPYPPPTEKEESGLVVVPKGMSFDLKGITFSYPGSQKVGVALDDVSLSIKAGQLVVIVGNNGSGKSTLIRILCRLYDPMSGQLLIDGHPSSAYRIGDLHRATSVLSQDNHIYPLSLGENIGLGYPDHANDQEMIEEAARLGGAHEFISKLKDGMATILTPMLQTFSFNLTGNEGHPLQKEMEKVKKNIDISGGERQRLAASRSFMRFKSGNIRFVAVDEPSSALDAEGELQLFNRLVEAREGKTMIFVTHRFGHLTKTADKIICMKNGSIVETGTHPQLMELEGEYCKLFNIQAAAFDDQNLIKI